MAGFQLTLHGRIWVTPEGPHKNPLAFSNPIVKHKQADLLTVCEEVFLQHASPRHGQHRSRCCADHRADEYALLVWAVILICGFLSSSRPRAHNRTAQNQACKQRGPEKGVASCKASDNGQSRGVAGTVAGTRCHYRNQEDKAADNENQKAE